jgi:hypothetical protein
MAGEGACDIISLEQQLSKFPAHLLDRPCAESHLGKLVHAIDTKNMILLATDLELSAVEVDDIQTAWPREPAVQRLEIFKKWLQKKQSQATYRWVLLTVKAIGVHVVLYCILKLNSFILL